MVKKLLLGLMLSSVVVQPARAFIDPLAASLVFAAVGASAALLVDYKKSQFDQKFMQNSADFDNRFNNLFATLTATDKPISSGKKLFPVVRPTEDLLHIMLPELRNSGLRYADFSGDKYFQIHVKTVKRVYIKGTNPKIKQLGEELKKLGYTVAIKIININDLITKKL